MTIEQYISTMIREVVDCYPVRADNGNIPLPYATYQIISRDRLLTVGQAYENRTWTRDRYRIQVNIFASTSPEVARIANELSDLLHGFIDEYSDTLIRQVDEIDMEPEQDGRNIPSFGRIQDYEVFYNE